MKKLLIALAGAACLLSSVSAAQADQLQDIEKRGVIRIAVPQDFPPFGSVGTDLQPQGYDIDMARYLAKSMKLKLQLVPVTSANRVPYLQTDKVDLVISSLGKNAEREKVIDFSRAYAPFFLGVFGPKGAELKDAAALSGKSIGVTRGAVEDMVLTSVAPQAAQIKRYEDNNTTLSAYLSGQGAVCRHRQSGGGGHLPAERRQSAGAELYAEGLAVLYRSEKERTGAEGESGYPH
ncbi:ABC-type amino acid transport/signal transduction system protein [Klebsiella pneumoniae]|uniref:ABC-type amino acid transport/signal transduction system protein n=1 Tax=Klebsiella pneumoniae TaxID=573 RepID=A0A377TVB2_KLEPN|nr:ABC-type amino acid transport/signal transduction system protein [Klebsiella pneumoniae]